MKIAINIPKKVSTLIYLIPFTLFGIMHLMNASMMAAYVPSFIPGAEFMVYLTGVALILPLVSFLMKKETKSAFFLLGIMMLVFVFTMHLPAVMGGNQASMTSLLKDLSLAGAAFLMSGHYNEK